MTQNIIRVGIGVVVLNPLGQILAGQRKSKHGQGSWSLVGGHLEFGESFEECARRETMEEAGLELKNIQFLTTANHFFEEKSKHYVTVYMIGRVNGDMPAVNEPEALEVWRYFNSFDEIPQPHFVPYLNDIDPEMIREYIRLN